MKQTKIFTQPSTQLTIDPALTEMAKKNLFPKKVEAAIETLSRVKLPEGWKKP